MRNPKKEARKELFNAKNFTKLLNIDTKCVQCQLQVFEVQKLELGVQQSSHVLESFPPPTSL